MIYGKKSAKAIDFQILPDNIHTTILTHTGTLYTIDHFSGKFLHQITLDTKYYRLTVCPSFDMSTAPFVFLSGDGGIESIPVDIMNSESQMVEAFNYRVICSLSGRILIAK